MKWLLQLVLTLSVTFCFTTAQNPEAAGRASSWIGGAEHEGALRALKWLEEAQDLGDGGGGWGSDAPRALLALQLSNCSWIPNAGMKAELAATKLELQIALLLWRHHEPPISPGRLAQYTLALGAMCKDPRDFHGHDLISLLLRHEPESDFEFAFVTLAVCNSGSHARKRHIRRLLDVTGDTDKHSADTLAMVVLALRCVAQEHRHRDLLRFVAPPALALAALQQADGSFGNLHTTALAMQALEGAGAIAWDRGAAMNLVLSSQAPDGSFGDTFTTTEVVLALQSRGLAQVSQCKCNKPRLPPSDTELEKLTHDSEISLLNIAKGPIIESFTYNNEVPLIAITYTLWAQRGGDAAGDMNAEVELRVPNNSTFFHAMQLAAHSDPRFTFESSVWPNGHYIHTLGGLEEDPSEYRYWLLYLLSERADPSLPPSKDKLTPKGVDEMFVKDGDHFLFWYKKL
ncbi:Hypothetical predicted protein [Cloeon dipterum]|nr:Hypothetical predicted protein [Cloeon dipterum]